MRKLCVVTGTRAEYGLLKPLMEAIRESAKFDLQVLATAAHLSPEFGSTHKLIEADGFSVDEKVEMLLSADTGTAIVKSMGVGMIGYADSFRRLMPDAVIILGDRFEMLAVASAAAVLKIPIIHLHGGEITEGAYDDAFRHAITKLSGLHFTSTEEYRKRVIQMGEQPDRVHNVGALGIDNIRRLTLLDKVELEQDLEITFSKYNYQVAFHPETLSENSVEQQFKTLLDVLKSEDESLFIFTKSNADTDGRIINAMIDDFVQAYPEKAKAFSSLGTLRFLSVLKFCNAIIGNSSSGILEAPSLGISTINIGQRQKGRIQAKSVINVDVATDQISAALKWTKEQAFLDRDLEIYNPYGDGQATEKIMEVLKNTDFKSIPYKSFYNINRTE